MNEETKRTYMRWRDMKTRCHNTKRETYKYYGGRGIKVSDEWLTFDNFLKDMGPCKSKMSLDRIDNNGNYCKENCRWVTMKEQTRNRRRHRLLTAYGQTLPVFAWAEALEIPQSRIRERILRGYSDHDALFTPKGSRKLSSLR